MKKGLAYLIFSNIVLSRRMDMKKKIITKTQVEEKVHELGLRITEDAREKLNEKVNELIDESVHRAKKNRRNTVMSQDM